MTFTRKERLATYLLISIVMVIVASVSYSGFVYLQQMQNAARQPSSFSTSILQSSSHSSSFSSTLQSSSSTSAISLLYKNGTYSAVKSYTPKQTPSVLQFSLTIENDTVIDANLKTISLDRESERYVKSFSSNFPARVVGKKLEEIDSVFISGASLTSQAFQQALVNIKNEAKN